MDTTESVKCRLQSTLRKLPPLSAEPTIFLIAVSLGLWVAVFPSFLYHKVCLSTYQDTGLAEKYCSNLENTSTISELEQVVQSTAAHISALLSIVQFGPLMLLVIPIGSISDRFGRKRPMTAGLTAWCLNCLILTISASVPSSALWLLFVAMSLSGGASAVIMLSWACIKDISQEPRRFSIHMSVIMGTLTGGIVAGSAASGFLEAYGYTCVMATTLGCATLALLYCLLVMKETFVRPVLAANKGDEYKILEAKRKFKDLDVGQFFRQMGIAQAFNTLVKYRPNHKRQSLCLGLLCYALLQVLDNGTLTVTFLFLKLPPLSWSDSLYSFFTAYEKLIASAGLPILTVVFKKGFRCRSELPLAITGTIALCFRLLFVSLSAKTWQVFAAISLMFVSTLALGAMRSHVALQVSSEESGSIFAVILLVDNLAFLSSAQFFNNVYPLSISIFPGLLFMVASGATLIVLLLIIYMYIDWKAAETKTDKNGIENLQNLNTIIQFISE